MTKKIHFSFLFVFLFLKLFSQGFPWERPLQITWSGDGITFNPPVIFQDSSGVPSVIRWNGDTLICAFQWFRAPMGSPSWDRVAVKLSYDNGTTWTQPTPIVVNGLPSNYMRPFDPTLLAIEGGEIRIYFSSGHGTSFMGLDSTVNTYSAKSMDGINYLFEVNPRVDEPVNRVIDPGVIHFKNAYHYASPIGSPQQGAYHYISPNGLSFTKVPDIPSDNNHNWTGNYMINDTNALRFYGAGSAGIWFNSTSNGGVWNGYTNTNIQGGDPSVLKVSENNYMMVFVGSQYATGLDNITATEKNLTVYPNPATNQVSVKAASSLLGSAYTICDNTGKEILTGKLNEETTIIEMENLPDGIYLFRIDDNSQQTFKVIKK